MLREIKSEKLIIVEGNDDEGFIRSILNKKHIFDVQIENLNGLPHFKEDIPIIIKSPFFEETVKKFAIIRDADNNVYNAFKSVKDILKNNDLIPPDKINTFTNNDIQIGIYIFHKPNSNYGKLEDLCLATVEDTEAMKCVNIFWECIKSLSDVPKDPSKSMCQAYRAAMYESFPHLGIAAEKGIWNLESIILNDLCSFLNMFKD